MDPERYRDSPIGRLVPVTLRYGGTDVEHESFVPAPLPSEVALSAATQLAVSRADQALGILEGVAGTLPNKDLLIRPTIRSEAVSTSALEGTYAGFREVLEAEVSPVSRARLEVTEVLNYTRTAETALEIIATEPISLRVMQGLHSQLVTGTRGDSPDTGRFRTVPVMIGPEGAPPQSAHFIPTPPGPEMDALLADWEAWNYAEDDIPSIVRIAVSHYQFETIHPFRDGNGRLGRLVAVLLLIERGPLSGHLLTLSPYLEARREEYGELLRQVSATGDYNPWVSFFAGALSAQATQARSRVERLLNWRQETVTHLRDQGVRGTAIAIAESLIGYPIVTPTGAKDQHNVSYRSANLAIARLESEGVLVEFTGRRYRRVFGAPDVIEILDG